MRIIKKIYSFIFPVVFTFSALNVILSFPTILCAEKSSHALFESHRPPLSFSKTEINASHRNFITLQIGLKQENINLIKRKLEKSSNPESPHYGRHLTAEEATKLSAPSDLSIRYVTEWLREHGFQGSDIDWNQARDWVTIKNVPLAKAENILRTKYYYYQSEEGEKMIRTEQYSLPLHLHSHIDLVQPTTMFGKLHAARSFALTENMISSPVRRRSNASLTVATECTDSWAVTNRCLRELYKTQGYVPRSISRGNKIAVTGYIGERVFSKDLQRYMAQERPDTKYRAKDFHTIYVNGGTNPQNNTLDEDSRHLGVEGNLDVQTTMGFTAPMPNIFYTTRGTPPFRADIFTTSNSNEPYLDWLNFILRQNDSALPQVISTSYGDNEQTVPKSYATRVCNQFAILGARGVSLIFSSGDNGVGEDGTCLSNDDQRTRKFTPVFPASCPYVTAVGATEGFKPEVAVSVGGPGGFSSGGGFSDYFTRPSYQQKHVSTYLKNLGDSQSGLFSKYGRGYPDVAAQGAKYMTLWKGNWYKISGTSAAAPTFASVIALVNDYRLSIGKPPLGFLNPWLYNQGAGGLNDILIGRATGCESEGFPAAKGWDPVTGLGTPDFPKLIQLTSKSSRRRSKDNIFEASFSACCLLKILGEEHCSGTNYSNCIHV